MKQMNLFDEINETQNNKEISIEEIEKFITEHEITQKVDTINTEIDINNRFSVISLFAGCGGLDLGFRGNFEYLGD